MNFDFEFGVIAIDKFLNLKPWRTTTKQLLLIIQLIQQQNSISGLNCQVKELAHLLIANKKLIENTHLLFYNKLLAYKQ